MASTHCMPIIVINLGAEMIYVLNQRLQAQDLGAKKIQTVLSDVIETMYNPNFVEELFRSAPMYTNQASCTIFERLAHSSIMRLNETSMGKLYDLMSMTFKYQLQNCVIPKQVIQVTLNHMDCISELANDSAKALIANTRSMFLARYVSFSEGQLLFLKQTLYRFLQDRRVKLSMFLQDKVQRTDGHMVLKLDGRSANPLPVGTAITYNDDGSEAEEWKVELKVLEVFKVLPGPPSDTTHGENLYLKHRSTNSKSQESKGADSSSETKIDSNAVRATATDELNLLASMIGNDEAAGSFKLNLNLDWGVDTEGGQDGLEKESTEIEGSSNLLLEAMPKAGSKSLPEDETVLEIDGKHERKTYDQRLAELDFGTETVRANTGASKEQDLLDLLDDDESEDELEQGQRSQGTSKWDD